MKRAISFIAITWFTTCLLFAGFTCATALFWSYVDGRHDRRAVQSMNLGAMKTVSSQEAERLMYVSAGLDRLAVDRPWLGFSEGPFHNGRFNIDAASPLPVRRTISTQAVPSSATPLLIWIFGGSTSLGYGVPDDQTIASHLETSLRRAYPGRDIRVVNHGHIAYFSSQEAALLAWLLRSGQRADVAVFLDGFNESFFRDDVPGGDAVPATPAARTFSISPWFPPIRFVAELQRRRQTRSSTSSEENARRGANAAARYTANVQLERAAANAHGMKTLFAWQPTPYAYLSRPATDPAVKRVFSVWPENRVFPYATEEVRRSTHDADFVFMADLFEHDRFADTYIDGCHYGDDANRKIAERLNEEIVRRGYLAPAVGAQASRLHPPGVSPGGTGRAEPRIRRGEDASP